MPHEFNYIDVYLYTQPNLYIDSEGILFNL